MPCFLFSLLAVTKVKQNNNLRLTQFRKCYIINM